MAIRQVHLEQEESVRRVLEWYRQGVDFADVLHLARSEGCEALISFDRSLVRQAAALSLKPQVLEP